MYEQNVVIDLEFNPVAKGHGRCKLRNEVIEVGAVRLGPHGEAKDTFQMFARPELEPQLSRIIVRLTGISDADLADAPSFEQTVAAFSAWVGPSKTRLVTWGPDDKRVFSRECEAHGMPVPGNLGRWLDLQAVYPRLMKINGGRRHVALRDAADWGCDSFDRASAHRALYDAQRTAELMTQVLDGSLSVQAEKIHAVMPAAEDRAPLSSSLGERCSELAELKRRLEAS